MKILKYLLNVLLMAVITFCLDVLLSLIYNLIAHGAATVDWDSSIRLALILGFILPLLSFRKKNEIN